MTGIFLEDLSWLEVASWLADRPPRVLIPLGSTENHGWHAPLGTDTIIARSLCMHLAPQISALVAPVLPFGHCPQHRAFAGSISISNRILASLLKEIVQELSRHGFSEFIFVSGHGGNQLAINLAIGEIVEDSPNLTCIHAHMLAIQTSESFRSEVEEQYGKPLSRIWGAHGGEQETSAVLAARPELINLDKVPPEPDVTAYLAATRDPAVTRADRNLVQHAPQGTWGAPESATPEQGALFYQKMAETLAARISSHLSRNSEEA